MRTYFISHPHARQKSEAIATLEALITALGLTIEIPAAGDRPFDKTFGTAWQGLVIHSTSLLRATIQVREGHAPDLDLKWLEIIDN
jgi:hypothetical protein